MKPDLRQQLQAALAGRYTLEREVGRGGMATVYLAHDREGTAVALKLLNPDLGSTIGAERFRREIRVAARLQHPNILSVLDSGVAAVPLGGGTVDFLWFTMPFVNGRNIWERFEQEGPLPADGGSVVLLLDSQSQVRGAVEVTRGLLNSSLMHPREVFRIAVMYGAAGIIVAHNHPSGDPTPSAEDRAVTRQLVEAGRLLDVPVYDHVILAGDRWVSFATKGLL